MRIRAIHGESCPRRARWTHRHAEDEPEPEQASEQEEVHGADEGEDDSEGFFEEHGRDLERILGGGSRRSLTEATASGFCPCEHATGCRSLRSQTKCIKHGQLPIVVGRCPIVRPDVDNKILLLRGSMSTPSRIVPRRSRGVLPRFSHPACGFGSSTVCPSVDIPLASTSAPAGARPCIAVSVPLRETSSTLRLAISAASSQSHPGLPLQPPPPHSPLQRQMTGDQLRTHLGSLAMLSLAARSLAAGAGIMPIDTDAHVRGGKYPTMPMPRTCSTFTTASPLRSRRVSIPCVPSRSPMCPATNTVRTEQGGGSCLYRGSIELSSLHSAELPCRMVSPKRE